MVCSHMMIRLRMGSRKEERSTLKFWREGKRIVIAFLLSEPSIWVRTFETHQKSLKLSERARRRVRVTMVAFAVGAFPRKSAPSIGH